jgi:hypothetical protein
MAEIQWVLSATGSLSDIQNLLGKEYSKQVQGMHELTPAQWGESKDQLQVECKGNQHKCQPTVFVPALNQRFDLEFVGTGDAVILGNTIGRDHWYGRRLHSHASIQYWEI